MKSMVTIEGFDEARKVLDTLPDKFQKQVVVQILRKSGQIFIDDAKSRLLNYGPNYQKLASAIGFIPVRTQNPVVVAGIRAKGKFKYIGYYGNWIEYGVSGVKKKLSSSVKKEGDESFRFWMAGVKKGERYRDDQPPRPYMRPAADSKKEVIQKDISVQFENRLYLETQRALARYGRSRGKS